MVVKYTSGSAHRLLLHSVIVLMIAHTVTGDKLSCLLMEPMNPWLLELIRDQTTIVYQFGFEICKSDLILLSHAPYVNVRIKT